MCVREYVKKFLDSLKGRNSPSELIPKVQVVKGGETGGEGSQRLVYSMSKIYDVEPSCLSKSIKTRSRTEDFGTNLVNGT